MEAIATRRGPAPTHTDEQYLAYDLGAGDDFPAEVECRKTAIVITRKEHLCYGVRCRAQKVIPAGTRAVRETGKCEGKFGSAYICLPCIDVALEPEWW